MTDFIGDEFAREIGKAFNVTIQLAAEEFSKAVIRLGEAMVRVTRSTQQLVQFRMADRSNIEIGDAITINEDGAVKGSPNNFLGIVQSVDENDRTCTVLLQGWPTTPQGQEVAQEGEGLYVADGGGIVLEGQSGNDLLGEVSSEFMQTTRQSQEGASMSSLAFDDTDYNPEGMLIADEMKCRIRDGRLYIFVNGEWVLHNRYLSDRTEAGSEEKSFKIEPKRMVDVE